MSSAKMTRGAQWWLAQNGFTNIENDTIRIGEVRILLSNRAIEYLNQQALDAGVDFKPWRREKRIRQASS